jgi:hypothetical protein
MRPSLSRFTVLSLCSLSILIGCSGSSTDELTGATSGIPVLGNGTHSTDSVLIEVVAIEADGFIDPCDLEFYP